MEFVVGASDAAMKAVLGKLGDFLAQEYSLIRGVRDDMEYINDELATVQAFLGDLGPSTDGHDLRLKDWMKHIRDLGYDMEDCVVEFAYRLPGDSLSDATCSFVLTRIHELWTFWPRHQIASKISDLRVRAQQIAKRRSRYGPDNPPSAKGNGTRTGSSSGTGSIAKHLTDSRQLIHIKEPVGAVADMKTLREWLTKHDGSERPRSVMSLVGFGGIGKTTIATALYREFCNEFDCQASVTVSQDCNEVIRDILRQIKPQDREQEQQGSSTRGTLAGGRKSSLKRFVPLICGLSKQCSSDSSSDIEAMDYGQLARLLNTCLKGKRYLLLIDDIWYEETWYKIRNGLPDDNIKDSRVIVTTRFEEVGAACSSHLHKVNVLSDDDSRTLFYHSVSKAQSSKGNETISTDNLDTADEHIDDSRTPLDHRISSDEIKSGKGSDNNDVPEEIWKYSTGLPLAIVTMAGLVTCNPKQKNGYWSTIFRSFFPDHEAPLTLDGVTRMLDYAYNNLPPHLRTCLLYFSIFPKGMAISTKRVTRRWISESFVTEKQGLTAEEVAETYFNQLISRNIIHPIDHSTSGKVKSFNVHDMVLEYIVSKSSQESFITVVGGHCLAPTPSKKVRRLSLQSSGSKHGSSTQGMNLSQVRSVTAFGSKNQRLPFHSFNTVIIQVLDLEGWKGVEQKHLSDICKMVALKYLSLRRTEVSEIPSNIHKLEYLETLDIRETNVTVLPRSLGRLKLLRSMLGGSKNPRKTLKFPQVMNQKEPMKGLRILSGVEITEESADVQSLHQLTGLRKLGIYKLDIQKGSRISRQLMSSIEYLGSCGLQALAITDEGSEFINSLDSMSAPPRYLISLELSGKMERPPKWIKILINLYKLTLSATVLASDTFKVIQELPKLFCLTFTLSAAKDDQDIVESLEETKQRTDMEIIVPPGGFKSLKLLRFFVTVVPRLRFAFTGEAVMPALERIDMRFQAFEGLYGIDTLQSLREVHLSVGYQADETTKRLVEDLKDMTKFSGKEDKTKWPKIIFS